MYLTYKFYWGYIPREGIFPEGGGLGEKRSRWSAGGGGERIPYSPPWGLVKLMWKITIFYTEKAKRNFQGDKFSN
jgi:hypothetical protein